MKSLTGLALSGGCLRPVPGRLPLGETYPNGWFAPTDNVKIRQAIRPMSDLFCGVMCD